VNDVDVTDFVRDELDRRQPERVRIRALRSATEPQADEVRDLWRIAEQGWTDAMARAERLPEPLRQERVEGEWSFVETLRHLTFCIDAWVSRTVLDEERPYHPLGFPAGGYPAGEAGALGLDLHATPTYLEAKDAFLSRQATYARVLAASPTPTCCGCARATPHPATRRSRSRCSAACASC